MWLSRIKKFYDAKLWTKDMVKEAVVFNKITDLQYFDITNEIYVPQ